MQTVQLLSATELKNKLIEVTIGGAKVSVDLEQRKCFLQNICRELFLR